MKNQADKRARVVGTVLGAAIGDAMGHPTEFLSMKDIHSKYGPQGVTGFELWRTSGNAKFAPYTDDTQMAEVVLRTLLDARGENLDLDDTMRLMGEGFVEWADHPQGGHRAPGNACLAGTRAFKSGTPWFESGGATAGGCGSVMRAYPFGLVFADDVEKAASWSVAHSKITHRDPIALAASAAMAVGVAHALNDVALDEPSLAHTLDAMVHEARRHSEQTASMMERAIDEARTGVDPEVTLDRNRAWAAHEAIAAAVYIFARHSDDGKAAILEGANTPGDSDSIATLAGALVGARRGVDAFPSDWLRDVERADALSALAWRVLDEFGS